MATTAPTARVTKRNLLLRDGLVFLTLCGVTAILFALTLLLFHSFESHREVLGRRWAARGEAALREGRPDTAVAALRTALSYGGGLPEQLLLAQALADAGHLEEATNYFLTLREGRPGDGFINLQLARLMRKEGDASRAVEYYRASIFGDWRGDGALRRREVRLELASYLANRGNANAARDELLIAAGNAPETAAYGALFGDRFAAIQDRADALQFYRRSLAQKPHQREVMAKAGRLAYTLGEYEQADKLLSGALTERSGAALPASEEEELAPLDANARRMPELSLSRELPASERAEHLLLAAQIAQSRLARCKAQGTPPATDTGAGVGTAPSPVLQALRARWKAAAGQLKKRSLERDAALEDQITQLIDDTEMQAQESCGPAMGDDALLLLLANSPASAARH